MKKLVFFDVDGTLTTKSNYIPETTIQAINQLKRKGVSPVIATGRPPLLIDEISERLGINSYIAMNGQYIVYEGKVIYSNPIAIDLVDQVVEFAKLRKDGIILCAERELIINSSLSLNSESISLKLLKKLAYLIPEKIQRRVMNQMMKKGPRKSDYQDKEIFMMNLNVGQLGEKEYIQKLEKLHFTRANKDSMDIINEGVSKASAVEIVLDYLDIKIENSFAFGDGLNDLEMLKFVGTGVAMGNAFEELKNAADLVTESVSDDGVQKALKKLELI